jgi:hypothetical protein
VTAGDTSFKLCSSRSFTPISFSYFLCSGWVYVLELVILLFGLPIVCSVLLGVVFCLDFDPFLFLLLPGVYLFIYI